MVECDSISIADQPGYVNWVCQIGMIEEHDAWPGPHREPQVLGYFAGRARLQPGVRVRRVHKNWVGSALVRGQAVWNVCTYSLGAGQVSDEP